MRKSFILTIPQNSCKCFMAAGVYSNPHVVHKVQRRPALYVSTAPSTLAVVGPLPRTTGVNRILPFLLATRLAPITLRPLTPTATNLDAYVSCVLHGSRDVRFCASMTTHTRPIHLRPEATPSVASIHDCTGVSMRNVASGLRRDAVLPAQCVDSPTAVFDARLSAPDLTTR